MDDIFLRWPLLFGMTFSSSQTYETYETYETHESSVIHVERTSRLKLASASTARAPQYQLDRSLSEK